LVVVFKLFERLKFRTFFYFVFKQLPQSCWVHAIRIYVIVETFMAKLPVKRTISVCILFVRLMWHFYYTVSQYLTTAEEWCTS